MTLLPLGGHHTWVKEKRFIEITSVNFVSSSLGKLFTSLLRVLSLPCVEIERFMRFGRKCNFCRLSLLKWYRTNFPSSFSVLTNFHQVTWWFFFCFRKFTSKDENLKGKERNLEILCFWCPNKIIFGCDSPNDFRALNPIDWGVKRERSIRTSFSTLNYLSKTLKNNWYLVPEFKYLSLCWINLN